MKTWLVVLALPGLLAGCLGSADGPTGQQDATLAYATAMEASFNATRDGAGHDVAAWFLLSAPASPVGTIAAFRWDVPDDARHVTDDGTEMILLHVVPLIEGRGLLAGAAWTLLAFADGPDGPEYVGGAIEPTTQRRSWISALESNDHLGPDVTPRHVLLRSPGGSMPTLHFLFAAQGDSGRELGVGIRAIDETPWLGTYAPPAVGPSAFLEAQGGRPPYVPPRLTEGEGLHIDQYESDAVLAVVHSESRSGNVVVEDTLPADTRVVGPTVRDVTITSTWDAPGWSMLQASYGGSGGTALWSVRADLHGNRVDGEGVLASPPHTEPELLLQPTGHASLAQAAGEGGGPSTAELHITDVHVGQAESVRFLHLGVGMPLAEIFGTAGTAGATAAESGLRR